MPRILLCDDHDLLLQGLCSLIEKQPDMEVVGQAKDGRELIDLAEQLAPDIVITNITMPELNGIEATRWIVSNLPKVKVIALTIHTGVQYVEEMLKAGASGYVSKISLHEELVRAIEVVAEGGMYLSSDILFRLKIR